tara:strand:- start:299 stop:523 length:225 start_codon:yes stop_codon:yes gene_type:complete
MKLYFSSFLLFAPGCGSLSWMIEPTESGAVPIVDAAEAAGEAFVTTSPGAGVLLGGVAAALTAGATLLKIRNKR